MKRSRPTSPRTARRPAAAALLLLLLGTAPAAAEGSITFSGTVTGPDSEPVPDVSVAVWSPEGSAEGTTDAAGTFDIEVPPGLLFAHLVPPRSTGLAERSMDLGERHESFAVEVQLVAGSLLRGVVETPDGSAFEDPIALEMWPAGDGPDAQGLTVPVQEGSGAFEVVAPRAVFWLSFQHPHGSLSSPVDLRGGDVTDVVLRSEEYPLDPFDLDPPDASKITVGEPDDLAEAVVTGEAGACRPFTVVVLVNADTAHLAHTVAEADGSFSAKLFAPPGSEILVRHGPASFRTASLHRGLSEGLNPFPATFVSVPPSASNGTGRWFADAGQADVETGDGDTDMITVPAAWSFEGSTTGATTLGPGDAFSLSGTLRLYSPGITTSTAVEQITVSTAMDLVRVFDPDGRQVPYSCSFMSTFLTPTGLPIQRAEPAGVPCAAEIIVGTPERVGDHAVEWTIDVPTVAIDENTPSGVYVPLMPFSFTGTPPSHSWVGADVFSGTLWFADLPPLAIDDGSLTTLERRLAWRLLMNDPVLGTRGCGAREDADWYEISTQIVTQGATPVVRRTDPLTGDLAAYRLEPFLPMVSWSDRVMPGSGLLPFSLPGGELRISIERPDGSVRELGSAPFTQALVRTPTTDGGRDLNEGTTQMDDVYSLTTRDDRFAVTFEEDGRHVITMTGTVEDAWGNTYTGGGTYELWVAEPLDIEPGVLPGTPLSVGDTFNPTIRVLPRVPADVELTVTHYPNSDPANAWSRTVTGRANAYGLFTSDDSSITFDEPGEYRVDLTAVSLNDDGRSFAGTATWGGIVMTPEGEGQLIAHGRRGADAQASMPGAWFVAADGLDVAEDAIAHMFNPFHHGDILWSRQEERLGDALLILGTVQDPVGDIADRIEEAIGRTYPWVTDADDWGDRLSAGELPLMTTTSSGESPRLHPEDVDIVAYSYRSSQRPGVRVREVISEDSETGGYWRLNTLYDQQPGVGVEGDNPNDFKFQYVGAVYRDLVNNHSEYVGHGTAWVLQPEDEAAGTRVMPPFSATGNGGWTTAGGPILTLDGEDVDLFIEPTGVGPGDILEVGDTFTFAGHIVPTLPSRVRVEVTSPSGTARSTEGRANRIGYFHEPAASFTVDQAGTWTVDVSVWHDGRCSGGATVSPYPSGSVLGTEGSYAFYVVPHGAGRLRAQSPRPGPLTFAGDVRPVEVSVLVPPGLQSAEAHVTISTPGFVLDQFRRAISGYRLRFSYDPVELAETYPNIDLSDRDAGLPGLADTVSITYLLTGTRGDGDTIHQAGALTLQGRHVLDGAKSRFRPPRSAGPRIP